MSNPLVSVLIDTYNHGRYIEQAIVSALEQDCPSGGIEILVVDDGSTDNTAAIVQRFAPRVRYLRKENGGQASAFNFGIAHARGEIVAFLDGDDWWAKEKLAAVVEAFGRNPGAAAVGHGFYVVRGGADPHEMVVPSKTCRLALSGVEAARLAAAGRNLLSTSDLSVRRKVLHRIGPIPDELVFCADVPISTLAFALGGAIVLDQALCYYRLHSQNLFERGADDPAWLGRKCEVLRFLLKTLPPRLAQMGVAPEAVDALFAMDRVDVERLELRLGRGGRWKSFRTETQRFRVSYERPTIGYRVFEWAVGACALLLPPRRFEQLRGWYAQNNMQRFRRFLGRPRPRVPEGLFQRQGVPGRQP